MHISVGYVEIVPSRFRACIKELNARLRGSACEDPTTETLVVTPVGILDALRATLILMKYLRK